MVQQVVAQQNWVVTGGEADLGSVGFGSVGHGLARCGSVGFGGVFSGSRVHNLGSHRLQLGAHLREEALCLPGPLLRLPDRLI